MTSLPRKRLALLLITPALALSACGGSSDSDTIKNLVKDVDKDSAALCDHATDKLLAQVGGTAEKCKQAARAYPDKGSIKGDITVKVDGNNATTEFDTSDGKHEKATLVKDGGDWKFDTVTGS